MLAVYGLEFLTTLFMINKFLKIVKLNARLPNAQVVEVHSNQSLKRLCLMGCLVLLIGCTEKISKEDLELLNGYWEIEKVIFPDGNSKEYSVNTNVDYISTDGERGVRKKMQPKFDGTFGTSNDTDVFVIVKHGDLFSMYYNTEDNIDPDKERVEELIALSERNFSVRNVDGLTYVYKRFEPFNLKE